MKQTITYYIKSLLLFCPQNKENQALIKII